MIFRRPVGVRTHLAAAAVALAVTSVAGAGVFTHAAVDDELAKFAQRDLAQEATQVATHAQFGYAQAGGWTSELVESLVRAESLENRTLVIRGPDGRPLPGSPRDPARDGAEAEVSVGGRVVGTVETVRRSGSGPPAARGAEETLPIQLSRRLEVRMVEAGVLAAVLALLLGLVVALRMARPLHRLTDVARRMAAGEIETRAAGSGGPRETTELAVTLDRLAAALRRQDELRRATVNDIVHELRNALVGVVGRIEALQDGMVVDEKAALERTARDARRLNRLVDDVLLLAEAQKPSLLVRKVPVDLHEVVNERAAAHADRFDSEGIAFRWRTTPARVDGDPGRLAQILDNLLSNALRYTDPGGSVEVRLESRGREAVLQVSDSGIGIAPEHLGRVFDRFWRDARARERVAEGSGVGLALVRDLALAHDGRVEVESRPGKGSAFSVLLPIAVDPHAEEPLVREPTPESADAAGSPMVWRLRGEIDAANAARIESELVEAVGRGSGDMVLDLTDVAFIDSSGLGSLVAVAAEVRKRGGHLAIVAGPPHVKRVFDLLQLDEVMELVDTRRDALASFTH
ncbi:MAG TPA: anti-sigma factor antagonist [Solirubrobacteraceae bacterium]|nr:anti-sigma factor antagonist [Solirubrobacteraceae bacterium]